MQATAAILEHACERSAMPRIPEALLCRRVVEVLPAYTMDGPLADEWTGQRAVVAKVHASGDVDLEMEFGGEVAVYHSRLRTLGSIR